MRKPILCLDFDGVIHSYSSGWKGAHVIPDKPVPGAIEALLGYLKDGFEVAIFSSRSKSLRGRWAMKTWLQYHLTQHFWNDDEVMANPNLPWTMLDVDEVHRNSAREIVRRIQWPWFKPAALMTIDDRALTFDGTWPSSQTIRAFQPWNKRPDYKLMLAEEDRH